MVYILAISVVVLVLSIVFLCCRMVYLNSVKIGINPYPWVLFEIIATPTLGSVIYILYCCTKGFELHFNAFSKLICILVVTFVLLVVCSIALAVVCYSSYLQF